MRHYYRCKDCLGTFAVEGERLQGIVCDCNGTWGHMGIVCQDRLVQEESRTPCDRRCTHASGPLCNCACKGQNHGTGRVVIVLADKGAVPKVQGLLEGYAERSKIAEEWRTMLTLAEKAYGLCVNYLQKNQVFTAMKKAKHLKTHGKRMKTLKEALS